jgi:CheY-like chemotaxis protein
MIEVYLSPIPVTRYYTDATKVLAYLNENKNNYNELPDIIFVDLNMPIMNGAMFLSKFAKLRPALVKHIDIYVVSSSIDPADIAVSKNYSFVLDYITKPITKSMLRKIVQEPEDH